jgi:thiamine-monophosphate kinase
MLSEDRVIESILSLCHHYRVAYRNAIGDDAAVLHHDSPFVQLISTDLLCEGEDFDLSCESAFAVGQKALKVNLSDIAAMGGRPDYVVLALNIPRSFTENILLQILDGFISCCADYGVGLVGGDTNSHQGRSIAIAVTILGQSHWRGPVLRGGAKPGDIIAVTGTLGGSRLGKHLNFRPRLDEAQQILDQVPLNAMVDLSDGLLRDLRHICRASQLSAVLDPSRIPVSTNVATMGLSHRESLHHALTDGEDFELCFTISTEAWHRLESDAKKLFQSLSITHIGWMQASDASGPALRWSDGTVIQGDGYQHQFENTPQQFFHDFDFARGTSLASSDPSPAIANP